MSERKGFAAVWDMKYAPLLALALPQSFNVGKWIFTSSGGQNYGYDTLMFWIILAVSIVGFTAFEMTYVASIAFAMESMNRGAAMLTSFAALLFSIAIAIRVYYPTEQWWSLLHTGFPIVSFLYTRVIHVTSKAVNLAEYHALIKDNATLETDKMLIQSMLDTVVKERDTAIHGGTRLWQQLQEMQRNAGKVLEVSEDTIVEALASGAWPLDRQAELLAKKLNSQGQAANALATTPQNISNWIKSRKSQVEFVS